MAFMKDEPGVYASKRTTFANPPLTQLTPETMAIQTANPWDEGRLQAMRDAQRRALMSYQKTTSPSTSAGYNTNAQDASEYQREKAMAREAAAAKAREAAAASAIPENNPLQDLVDQGIISDEEAQAQAAKMFAPQLAYLDTLSKQAQGRAGEAGKKIGDLYAAMQKGYQTEKTPTAALYDKANKDMAAIYGENIATNTKGQQATEQRTAQLLKSLGIQSAAPDLFKEGQAATQAANTRASGELATQKSGNTNRRTEAIADLTVKGQAAGLMNADQQWALQMKLQDILGGYGMKKAELQGMQASAAQDILNRSQSSQSDAVKALMQQQQQAFENDVTLRRLGLDERKFAADTAGGGAGGKEEKLSPIQEIAASAAESYSKFNKERYGSSEAREATDNGLKAITDAASTFASQHGDRPPKDAQEFMDWVRSNNPKAKDIAILRDLAQRYYKAAWG